jgi:hypothetical protein
VFGRKNLQYIGGWKVTWLTTSIFTGLVAGHGGKGGANVALRAGIFKVGGRGGAPSTTPWVLAGIWAQEKIGPWTICI